MQTHDHHSLNDTHVSDKKGSSVFSLPSVQIILVVLVFLAGFTVVKLYNRSDTPDLDLSGKGVGGETCTYKWSVLPVTTQTPTPTPTGQPDCENCNYQVDAYWGPVIRAFKENIDGVDVTYRYHGTGPRGGKNVNRLLQSRSRGANTNTGFPACDVGDDIVPNPAPPIVTEEPCDGADVKNDLSAEIDITNAPIGKGGIVSAKITNRNGNGKDCTYDVGFASYRRDAGLNDPALYDTQEYIEHQETTLGPGENITLYARVAVLDENEDQCIDLPN